MDNKSKTAQPAPQGGDKLPATPAPAASGVGDRAARPPVPEPAPGGAGAHARQQHEKAKAMPPQWGKK